MGYVALSTICDLKLDFVHIRTKDETESVRSDFTNVLIVVIVRVHTVAAAAAWWRRSPTTATHPPTRRARSPRVTDAE